MIAAALAAFVAGAFLLQQQARLPNAALLVGLTAAAAIALFAAARIRTATRAMEEPHAAGSAGDGDRRTVGETPEFGGAAANARSWPRRWLTGALVCGAAAALGFSYAALRADARLADELAFHDEGRDIVVVGIVDSLPSPVERGTRFEFAVERVETPGAHVPARVALGWYGAQAAVVPAERWRFTVRLRRPHGLMNPGGFDLEAWLLERELRATGYVREGRLDEAPRRLDTRVLQLGPLIDRARDHLRSSLQQRLRDARWGGVIVALVLGDQRAIREGDWLLFNRTGISHLVSISGLHITMIAGLAAWLAAALWRRSARLLALSSVQGAAAVAGVTAALLYCLLAGWGVPAQRTFFMLCTVALALVARVSMRPTVTLALAAGAVALLDPWAVQAAGFWLSFGAVAAILLVMHARTRPPQRGWRGRLADAANAQAAVTVALVPLTIALFQQVSFVSPLANAVAIPLVSLAVTPLALLGALLVVLPAPLDAFAVPCLAVAHGLLSLLGAALQSLAAPALSLATLPAPPAWALLFALAGVLWLLMPRGWPMRWLGALWLLPLFVWPGERPAPDELWVTAIDVGQGAAVLLETRDATVLYDTGPRWSPQVDAGGRAILPYLRWRGIGRLDLLVVSHLDSDHSGGAASLLAGVPVGRVLTSIDAAHPVLAGAPRVERCVAGQTVQHGGLALRMLRPTTADYARGDRSTNAMSCVLLAEFGAARALLAGDLPAREEAQLLAQGAPGPLTLVAAPHHGSRHSSSEALVAATRPPWVLFQAGYRNRFGHPAPEVVARWRAAGAVARRTDAGGALQWRLRADGSGRVEGARSALRRYWHNQPREPLQPPEAPTSPGPLEPIAPRAPAEASDDDPPSLHPSWPGEAPPVDAAPS